MEDFVQLVHRAQMGNTEAFTLLVARFQNMVYGYAYAILGDFNLAQDAAQEAFIEAYQGLPDLREPLAFAAWLKRIVFKHCDRLTRRKQLQIISFESIAETACPQPGPHDLLEHSELSKQVQKAVNTIPVNFRMVMILFYIGEYSLQEIADFLGLPAKTVKSRLYTARQRFKERMLNMVHDEFENNHLPEKFTLETVDQAVKRAALLNEERHFDKAEMLLRSLLAQAPEHPGVLKELNRAVMRGRVYGVGHWHLLAELAAQGKMILKTTSDEEVHRQVALTLLAIPAMQEAISFLEQWIAENGPTIERLGMLAWAKGSSGNFPAAEVLWDELALLALAQTEEQVLRQVPFIAYTLVDCLTAAGKIPSAQTIAWQAWDLCGKLGPLPVQETFVDDSDWLSLWYTAQLNLNEIAPVLMARHAGNPDLAEQAVRLAIRGWLDTPDTVIAAWLNWARACATTQEVFLLEKYRLPSMRALRARGFWQEANRLAWQIWQLLGDTQTNEVQQIRARWDWERFNPVPAIEARDWLAAFDLVQAEIKERGVQGATGWAAVVAGGSSRPTPPEILRALEENGVDKVDEYGMFGWYIIAREAGHAGELVKAFDALRRALSYWSNKPYWISDLWENDEYWGALRGHSEFKQAFELRRQRIGTVYGWLHYFPGW